MSQDSYLEEVRWSSAKGGCIEKHLVLVCNLRGVLCAVLFVSDVTSFILSTVCFTLYIMVFFSAVKVSYSRLTIKQWTYHSGRLVEIPGWGIRLPHGLYHHSMLVRKQSAILAYDLLYSDLTEVVMLDSFPRCPSVSFFLVFLSIPIRVMGCYLERVLDFFTTDLSCSLKAIIP